MSFDEQRILSGLGIITHQDSDTIGISPGSKSSPYTTDFGSWMPCPFHQSNTYNTAVDTAETYPWLEIDSVATAMLPWSIIPEPSSRNTVEKYFCSDTVTLISPMLNTAVDDVFADSTEFMTNIGTFSTLRTLVTCGHPAILDGSAAGTNTEIGFGAYTKFQHTDLSSLTLDPDNNRITMTSGQAALYGHWGELGHINGIGGHITICKTLNTAEDPFPSDYYGTYRILYTDNSQLSLVIDPDFKAIPAGQAITLDCIVVGDSWLVNHAGYNTLSPPFPLMEASYDPNNTGGAGFNRTPDTCGYKIKSCFKRTDAITTMYMSFDGTRGPTYQSLTGRAASHRVRDVRYKTSTVINGVAVIGNVDTVDDIGQTYRERNRIMWSTPMAVDEFGFFRSKMIGSSDADGIIALKSYSGRIICVKNNNTYILNPAANFAEEGRIIGAGSDWESCVTRTPVGIAVANTNAIYIVPSKQEITLGIKETYQNLTFTNPVMGYSGKHNELVFIPDTSANGSEMWVFNFNSKGWSKLTYTSGSTYSNLLYGGDNELLMVKETVTTGSDIVQNGSDFASNWATTGWTIGSGDATHNTSNTSSLTGTGGTTVATQKYRVTVTTDATGTSGKTCVVSLGAGGGTTYTIFAGTAVNYSFDLQSGTTTGTQLSFSPASDYDGKIQSCSAKLVTTVQNIVKYSSGGDTVRDNTKLVLHTKDFIFDEPNVSKYVKSFIMTYKSLIESTIYIYVNGTLDGHKTLPVNRTLRNRKININRECQSISFKIESDDTGGTDNDFIIEDMTIEGWYNDKK